MKKIKTTLDDNNFVLEEAWIPTPSGKNRLVPENDLDKKLLKSAVIATAEGTRTEFANKTHDYYFNWGNIDFDDQGLAKIQAIGNAKNFAPLTFFNDTRIIDFICWVEEYDEKIVAFVSVDKASKRKYQKLVVGDSPDFVGSKIVLFDEVTILDS